MCHGQVQGHRWGLRGGRGGKGLVALPCAPVAEVACMHRLILVHLPAGAGATKHARAGVASARKCLKPTRGHSLGSPHHDQPRSRSWLGSWTWTGPWCSAGSRNSRSGRRSERAGRGILSHSPVDVFQSRETCSCRVRTRAWVRARTCCAASALADWARQAGGCAPDVPLHSKASSAAEERQAKDSNNNADMIYRHLPPAGSVTPS